MTPLSDHAIVEGLLKGERECDRTVRSWCLKAATYRTRGSAIDAHDLASETFVNLYEELVSGRYRDEGLKAYIQAICTYKYYNRLKDLKRNPDCNQDALNEIPAKTLSADEAALQILRRGLFLKALKRLSKEHRQIIIERLKGIDYKTLAKQFQVSADTLRKRHFDAIWLMTEWIEKYQKP